MISPSLRFRASLVAGCVLLCLSGCASDSDGPSPPARPNVVFVVVDTLRADHMSLYGYERSTTPKIDELSKRGTVFEQALAGSSWTLPSMAMLFTGTYLPPSVKQLGSGEYPLTESFFNAGYRTGAVISNPLLGKVRNLLARDEQPKSFASGFERGFDSFDVFELSPTDSTPEFGQTNGWYGGEVVQRGTDWVESTDVQQDEESSPYFLYLHLFDPHFPRTPKDPTRVLAEPSEERFADLLSRSPGVKASAQSRKLYAWVEDEIALYDSEVAHVDDALGALFAWLESRGELESTVVVLTSDHGEGLWERELPEGEKPKLYNQLPALYSDHGIQLYSEQTRVPLVIWGPGITPGERVTEAVSLLDVSPTLHVLADIAPPVQAPAFSGGDLFGERELHQDVFSFCTRSASLTEGGRWRLHLPANYRSEGFGVLPELYDLEADPQERNPVADSGRIEAMSMRIREHQERAAKREELAAEEVLARRKLLDGLGYTDQ